MGDVVLRVDDEPVHVPEVMSIAGDDQLARRISTSFFGIRSYITAKSVGIGSSSCAV